jgi:hypothetical protein
MGFPFFSCDNVQINNCLIADCRLGMGYWVIGVFGYGLKAESYGSSYCPGAGLGFVDVFG